MSTSLPNPLPCSRFGRHGPLLVFAHANGYPPAAYAPFLACLEGDYQILAFHNRMLWPGSDPASVRDWQPFADDLAYGLDQRGLQGLPAIGHSIGATTCLRLALQQPGRFSALVLIDPVLLPPWHSLFWDLVFRLGLAYRAHPLISATLRRRRLFASPEAMFANYRSKGVFQRLSDAALWAYVQAIARPRPDGQVELCYPPEWEARIYATGLRRDLEIWRLLPRLRPPVLVLRGALTDTFWESTAALFQRRLPAAQILTLPETTHLLPLEQPEQTARPILEFLRRLPYTRSS